MQSLKNVWEILCIIINTKWVTWVVEVEQTDSEEIVGIKWVVDVCTSSHAALAIIYCIDYCP